MEFNLNCVKLFLAVTVALFPLVALAFDDKPVIWVDHEASLAGRLITNVLPVTDESGKQIPEERLKEIQSALTERLMAKEVLLTQSGNTNKAGTLIAKVSVTSFKTGDAVGRWFGFGAGAAKCSIRLELLNVQSSAVVADVIDTRVVDTGGFFTIGTDSTFHKDLAKELADIVANILKDGGGQ